MKNKYLIWLFGISPVLAAFSSYGINLIAAAGLSSAAEYSVYLSLQSWAVYFGSISSVCLVEMKQSPNGHCYSLFRLFFLATITSLIGVIGMVVASAAMDSVELVAIGITGFFYAGLRNLMMVMLMAGIPSVPVGLRITRSCLLLGLGGLLSTGILGHSTPLHFLAVQAVAAGIAISLYVPHIPIPTLPRLGANLRKLWELDKGRWGRRNLSYFVDMLHMPLFYIAIGMVAAGAEYNNIVYIVGLLIPLAAVLSEIIGERFRLHYGFADIGSLRRLFIPYMGIARVALIFCFVYFACCSLLVLVAINDACPKNVVLMACFSLQLALACTSSLFGVVISRVGLDKIDLAINVAVLAMLSASLKIEGLGATVAIFASMLMSAKYLAQFFVAYFEITKE